MSLAYLAVMVAEIPSLQAVIAGSAPVYMASFSTEVGGRSSVMLRSLAAAPDLLGGMGLQELMPVMLIIVYSCLVT